MDTDLWILALFGAFVSGMSTENLIARVMDKQK